MQHESFEDHLNKIHKLYKILLKAAFKINAEKSFFAQDEIKYLGFTA